MYWVHGVVHGRVIPHEVNHLIWIVLRGLHVGSERTSGALKEKKKHLYSEPKKIDISGLKKLILSSCFTVILCVGFADVCILFRQFLFKVKISERLSVLPACCGILMWGSVDSKLTVPGRG